MDLNILDYMRPKFAKLDGNATAERAVELTLFSTVAGAGLSAVSLSISPASVGAAAVRTGALTASCAALGAIFATTTGATAAFRGKDTPLNYFVGGCVSGMFLGARTQSIAVGSGTCVALGSWAAFYKLWKVKDWGPLIPPPTY